jgi:hypothetical protein
MKGSPRPPCGVAQAPPRMPRRMGIALVLLVSLHAAGCKRKHVPVEVSPELGYPSCDDAGAAGVEASTIVARGHIRAGPFSQDKNVVERFELRRTACGYTLLSRQEWPLAISDVQVFYDTNLAPLWAWKRMTIAGSRRADGNADTRRYELRTGEVFIKRRDAQGDVTLEKLLSGGRMTVPQGARVDAVVGPGRGIITPWLKQAKLPVGRKVRALVLDFREMVEMLEMATLERNPDQFEPSLGGMVRVYTFFGRETVFADQDDVVIGDLAGMRPSESLSTPAPEPLPMYGLPDPTTTP